MFNWREIPFVRILFPLLAGIILAMQLDQPFPVFDYLLLALLFVLLLLSQMRQAFRHRWTYGLILNFFFVVFGYQLAFYHTDLNAKDHFKSRIASENLVIGIVNNSPSFNSKFVKINLKTRQIGKPFGTMTDCQGTILLTLPNDSRTRELNYGDRILCKTNIRPTASPRNPEAFDYSRFLHLKNIDFQGFVRANEWQPLDSLNGNPVLHLSQRLRHDFLDVLETHLTKKNEYAVGSALILGYKDELNEDLKTAYANTGAMHVLAVSGLHVGMIWGIVAMLLGRIRWRHPAWKWLKMSISLICLWLFALITGASPSVLRATTMFSFVIAGMTLSRSGNIYNTLAASAFCLLLFNPFLVYEVGFQLSYFAVMGIVYFQPKIYRLWYIENRVGNFFWELTAVAIAAQITTFPLSLYYFHQFPLYFWLSGFVVIPFAFLILGGGVMLLVIHAILPFLAVYAGMLLNGLIWMMNSLIFLIEQIPYGLLSGIWISVGMMIAAYGFILLTAFFINTKKLSWMVAAMSFAVFFCGMYAFRNIENQLRKEIVFYHIPKKTHVEFIEKGKVLSFGDHDVDQKALSFATQDYHMARGVSATENFHFGYEPVQFDNWMQTAGFVQFYDKKIAFLKHLPEAGTRPKIKLDYVVVRKHANFNLDELSELFDFETIILDGAVEFWKRKRWKQACTDADVPLYDLSDEGALISAIQR